MFIFDLSLQRVAKAWAGCWVEMETSMSLSSVRWMSLSLQRSSTPGSEREKQPASFTIHSTDTSLGIKATSKDVWRVSNRSFFQNWSMMFLCLLSCFPVTTPELRKATCQTERRQNLYDQGGKTFLPKAIQEFSSTLRCVYVYMYVLVYPNIRSVLNRCRRVSVRSFLRVCVCVGDLPASVINLGHSRGAARRTFSTGRVIVQQPNKSQPPSLPLFALSFPLSSPSHSLLLCYSFSSF